MIRLRAACATTLSLSMIIMTTYNVAAEPSVLFDPTAFADVGRPNTLTEVTAVSSSTIALTSDLASALRAAGLVSETTAALGKTLGVAGQLIDTINGVKTIYSVSQATTLSGIANALSSHDFSNEQAGLSTIGDSLTTARNSANAINPIIPPIKIYYDAAVDPAAHPVIVSALNTTRDLQSSIQANVTTIDALTNQLTSYSSTVKTAATQAGAKAEALLQLAGTLSTDPASSLFKIVTVDVVVPTLIADQLSLSDLAKQVDGVVSQAASLTSMYNAKSAALVPLVSVYQAAAAEPLANASWKIVGSFDGNGSSYTDTYGGYSLSFVGNSFQTQGLIAPDRFIAGVLTVHNGSGTIGQTNHDLDLTLTRTVEFNGQQTVGETTAVVSLEYVTTPFNDDPEISADNVFLPSLGKGATIYEGATEPFLLLGQVHSPFQVIDITLQDPTDPFAYISTSRIPMGRSANVPEPGSALLIFSAFGAVLLTNATLPRVSRCLRFISGLRMDRVS